ncbi:MAG: hypothetical protein KDJ77_18010 [Rhodobiaceae bacterium]|nr:hypothetical protein [Rhodobiaceae bacterium]
MRDIAIRAGRLAGILLVLCGVGLSALNAYDWYFGDPEMWREGDFVTVQIRCATIVLFGCLVFLVMRSLRQRR